MALGKKGENKFISVNHACFSHYQPIMLVRNYVGYVRINYAWFTKINLFLFTIAIPTLLFISLK